MIANPFLFKQSYQWTTNNHFFGADIYVNKSSFVCKLQSSYSVTICKIKIGSIISPTFKEVTLYPGQFSFRAAVRFNVKLCVCVCVYIIHITVYNVYRYKYMHTSVGFAKLGNGFAPKEPTVPNTAEKIKTTINKIITTYG